jgi:hypothetical protein
VIVMKLTILLVLIALPTAAHAQQREFYDTRTGKSIGRAVTDGQGSTTV